MEAETEVEGMEEAMAEEKGAEATAAVASAEAETAPAGSRSCIREFRQSQT